MGAAAAALAPSALQLPVFNIPLLSLHHYQMPQIIGGTACLSDVDSCQTYVV